MKQSGYSWGPRRFVTTVAVERQRRRRWEWAAWIATLGIVVALVALAVHQAGLSNAWGLVP